MEQFSLEGRVALVTGGNRGLGRGIAEGLGKAGAKLMIAARDLAACENTVADFREMGITADMVEMDVMLEEDCQNGIAAAVKTFGKLDILVNNAGVTVRKQPEEISADEWERVIKTNLTSCFHCSKAAFWEMRKIGSGKIINIGSMHSIFGATHTAPYSASKGGIVQLTKSMAVAWAKYDIQVNAILPGYIETELMVRARNEVAGIEERVVNRTPAGRFGLPEEVAGAAVFLAAPASSFLVGTSIAVDGGYSVLG